MNPDRENDIEGGLLARINELKQQADKKMAEKKYLGAALLFTRVATVCEMIHEIRVELADTPPDWSAP